MSEIFNHYGLGAVRLCTHGLPNLDTRCPYCERDELRAALAQSQERAESLSRELLDAMQARDSYRETAAYAESRAERLEAALRASVVAMKRWSAEEDGLPVAPIGAHEAVAAAESIVGYVWAGWGPDPTRAALGEEGK